MKSTFLDKPTQSQYFVQPEYESILSANQLKDASDFLNLPGGIVVRSVPGRATRRIELKLPDGSMLAAYLKCYESALPWPHRWLNSTRRIENKLESLNEWRQIHALRQLGFQTADPIAAGWQQIRETGLIRSFVMTAEIRDAVQGNDFWAASDDSQRRNLIQRIADLARRFHQAGFIHKDFYLGHIFVAERGDELNLTLIDLQRVLGPRTFRTRWLVKDIGSILYSLEKAGAQRAELLRLFKLYKGGRRLGAAEKFFLRRTFKQTVRLHGRKPKYGRITPQVR